MKADAIIVLGHKLTKKGLSKTGKERLDKAAELHKIAKKIVVSGKEAEAMKKYLAGKGIKEIILEKKSKDTWSNAINTRELVNEKKWKSVIVITSDYHMERVKKIFSKALKGVKVSFEKSKTNKMKFVMLLLRIKEKILGINIG